MFWPKDLLAKDLPNARILTFGYDADIIRGLNTAGSNTLRDHGKALAIDVAMRRTRTDSVSHACFFDNESGALTAHTESAPYHLRCTQSWWIGC